MVQEYLEIITDPAHGLAEFTYSLVIDLLVIGLVWGTVWTKWLAPRLKREVHEEIDNSHGYQHSSPTLTLGERPSAERRISSNVKIFWPEYER